MNVGPLGWHDNPQAVAETESRLCASGLLQLCGSGNPMDGYARKQIGKGLTYCLAQEAEAALGMSQPANNQSRGTCVDQGCTRAVQDSLYHLIHLGSLVTAPIRVARGPVYAFARRQWRYGASYGNGNDGLAVCHWAEAAASLIGVYPRRAIGKIDLAKNEEQHAIDWANSGFPSSLAKAGVKVRAHRPKTCEELADCIWAGCFGGQGSGKFFDGSDDDGFAVMQSLKGGGHCEEACGAYVDDGGEIQFVRQQSWGDSKPSPQPFMIEPADHPSIKLRPGSYPVRNDDMAEMLDRGEVWCFQPLTGFEGGA